MTAEREEVFGHGLLRAATKAINLCFAGVLATSSVILESWMLFGVSVAGYAGLVAWDLSRIGFWRHVLNELRTRPPPLPDADSFAETGARHFVTRLSLARAEMRRVLTAAGDRLPVRLVSQLGALPEMEKRALALIGRLEELSRYLADKNLRGLRNEVERVRRASENTVSPRLREEYKRAHGALDAELRALEEIVAAKDLLMAKLETLAGTLELVPCEIVRLQVVEADAREHGEELSFDPRAILAETESVESLLAAPVGAAGR